LTYNEEWKESIESILLTKISDVTKTCDTRLGERPKCLLTPRTAAGIVARALNPKPPHFRNQSSSRDSQAGCGSVPAADHPLGLFQSLEDVVPSGVFQGLQAGTLADRGHTTFLRSQLT
jgi:hypothetical protein